MKKSFQATLVLVLFILAGTRQAVVAADSAEACGQFVQKFYDWYLAREKTLGKKNRGDSIMEVAMKEKRSAFSPQLLKGLQEDVAAAGKNPGEIVGLDFDPILNSQEDPEKYVVGKVTPKGDEPSNVHYLVVLFAYLDGKKDEKPTVTPELVLKNGQWVFSNFHYEKDDLLNVLKALKKERADLKKEGKVKG